MSVLSDTRVDCKARLSGINPYTGVESSLSLHSIVLVHTVLKGEPVPRRSTFYRAPADWIVEGEWPTGRFDAEAPEAIGHAVAIAVALAVALEGRNKSEVAAGAQINRSTLYDILAGRTWPDTVTLANLEALLGHPLWPNDPPPPLRRLDT